MLNTLVAGFVFRARAAKVVAARVGVIPVIAAGVGVVPIYEFCGAVHGSWSGRGPGHRWR